MSTQSCSLKLGGKPCQIMQSNQYPEANGLANSYRCPRGQDPGRAYVLMLKKDLDNLNLETTQPLEFTAGETCTFPGLYFIRATRVSGGHHTDPNGLQMIELADVRHLLGTMTACEKFINVRCPAPPAASGASMYYADSLNTGSLYTWQTAITALWPSLAGAVPNLPYTPAGNPEGFRFVGVSAWAAVHEVLEKIGCTTAYNPFTARFSIVRMGAAQSDFTAAKQANQSYLRDSDIYTNVAGRIPHTIRVFFHRQEVDYGIEKDTIQGTGQWAMDPAYSVDVATGRTGAVAGTVLPLWDDLPALTIHDGSVSNASDCSTRATARATEWLAQWETSLLHRRYSGCLTDFLPGAQVVEVVWSQLSIEHGYTTEVAAGAAPQPSKLILPGCGRENLAPPDMARRQFPTYPRTDQIVQPWDGVAAAGKLLVPNSDHVVSGRVMRYVNGAFAALENCWLMPMDIGKGTSATNETDTTLIAGDRLLGRLMGTLTVSADTRPLYVVEVDSTLDLVSLQSATTDTALTASPATMAIGGASPVLPSWMTIVSNEIRIGDEAIGGYLLFSGCLGIKKTVTATEVSAAKITLEWWDSGFSAFAGLWLDDLYLAMDDSNQYQRRSPTCIWGPIKSGDKFQVTAVQTAGTFDTIYYIGGTAEIRLDIQLIRNGRGFGTRSN